MIIFPGTTEVRVHCFLADVAIAAELAMRKRMAGGTGDTANPERSPDEEAPTHRPKGLFRELLYDINPINVQDWSNANIPVKIILVLRAPVTFVLQCIIPVVNETAEKRGWSKLLNCIQLVVSPMLAFIKLEGNIDARREYIIEL